MIAYFKPLPDRRDRKGKAMKIRQTLNNNADQFAATVYEKSGKIVVIKRDTFNHYDNSTDEKFEFSSISDFEKWKTAQEWIIPKKIKIISPFKTVQL